MSHKWKKSPKIKATALKEFRLIEAAADLSIEAGASDDGKKLRKFSMTAYTGVPFKIAGFSLPVIVELSGLNIESQQRPILLRHTDDAIVGHSEAIEVTAQRLRVAGVISGIDEAAQKVIGLHDNGFPWQASIGADPQEVEILEKGNTANVNGRRVSGPMYVVRKSTLKEVSFVSVGADSATSASIAATQDKTSREKSMNEFEKWLEEKGFDAETMSDAQKATLQAAFKAEKQPPPVKNDPPQDPAKEIGDVVAAARKEQERRQQITETIAEAVKDQPVDVIDSVEKIGKLAIEGRWDCQRLDLELLKARRPTALPFGYASGRQPDINGKVLEAAVCMAGGLEAIDKHYDAQTLEAANKSFRGGIGLGELILMFARRNGYSNLSIGSNIGQALRAAFGPVDGREIKAQGPSTYSLPGILSNVANKFLKTGFDFVESTWREIAAIRNVRDFKTISSYALTGDLTYEEVPPGGEMKHGTLGEEEYTNRARTYGKMLGIDRRDIINDDIGAFTAAGRRLGRGGALKLNRVFWAEFMDNSTFFTAARKNFDDGADSAFDSDGFEAANLLFLNQTDPDGQTLSVMPKILLVPNALKIAAWRLINSQVVPNTTDDANPWAGMFRVVSSAYLSDTTITGNSTTAWYLLADPNDLPVIEVAFLNGVETPTVETADMDFDRLGISMRGFHDFGIALQEFRGAVKFAGV